MEQNEGEAYRQTTAKLYLYAATSAKEAIPDELVGDSKDYYCKRDYTQYLCGLIKGMTEIELNSIVYNARSKQSRELADWWEEHESGETRREQEDIEAEREHERQTRFDLICERIQDCSIDELETIDDAITNILGEE
jgi:hypothetical protein